MARNNTCNCTERTGNGTEFTIGLLSGVLLGGLAAYVMFAPKGKENATKAITKAVKLVEKTQKEAVDKGKVAVEKIKKAQEEDKLPTTEEIASEVKQLKKRFFKKKGKKLV